MNLFGNLDEGLVENMARERAREILAEVWPPQEIEALRREQELNEAILDRQFNLNQLTIADELASLKDFIEMSQLPKANAKGYLAEAKRKLVLTDRVYARDKNAMKKKWYVYMYNIFCTYIVVYYCCLHGHTLSYRVKEAMVTYISAREKKENKEKDKKEKMEKMASSSSHSSLSSPNRHETAGEASTSSSEEKETRRQKGFTLEQCVSVIRDRTKQEGTYASYSKL